jgi:hypothetical protein
MYLNFRVRSVLMEDVLTVIRFWLIPQIKYNIYKISLNVTKKNLKVIYFKNVELTKRDRRERAHLEELGVDGRIILSRSSRDRLEAVDRIDLAPDRYRGQALVNAVINHRVAQNARNIKFWNRCIYISILKLAFVQKLITFLFMKILCCKINYTTLKKGTGFIYIFLLCSNFIVPHKRMNIRSVLQTLEFENH